MDERNFDWDNFRLFLEVARAGGLGPAAAHTGKSAPTLGRRMLELERSLGRDLFQRRPRGYELTEEGAALLAEVARIETHVLPITKKAQAHRLPLVKFSAGTWVTQILMSVADELVGSIPVRLRFISSESVMDIGHREAVIGVRNHRPMDDRLAGRRVGWVRFAIYAADENITTWAQVLTKTPSAIWVRDNFKDAHAIEVTAPQNALDLAQAGLARVVLPMFIGDAQPKLKQLSDPIAVLSHEQWLVSHHDDRFLPEVRDVIDRTHAFLKKAYADQ